MSSSSKVLIIKKRKSKKPLNTFTNDINNSLNEIEDNNFPFIGIIPIYSSRKQTNEYKKNTMYINVTRLYLKNKSIFYSLENKDLSFNIYNHLESIFNIKKNDIFNLHSFKNNNHLLIYICHLKDLNKIKTIDNYNWTNYIETYNLNSCKYEYNSSIYLSIINNEFRFNKHLDFYLESESDNDNNIKIKILDIYKKLI